MKREENGAAPEMERSYVAFISYRHKSLDKRAAEKLQRSIERYTVPREFRDRSGGRRLGMVFRDEDELPASASLSDSITYALDHSRFLLVVCTPDLPLSKWCEQEIRYFLQTHDRDHVLAILADGTPDVSFSPWLLHTYDGEGNVTGDTEPLAANIAGKDHSIDESLYRKEIVRVYAALLGCPFDALWQRERRARTQRLAALLGTVIAVLAGFAGLTLAKNAEISARNEQINAQNELLSEQYAEISSQNERITAQNAEILAQSEQIAAQNLSLEAQLSATLVDSGRSKLENHDLRGALEDALASLLDGRKDAPYDRRAEKLLDDALGAYRGDYPRSTILYEHGFDVLKFVPVEEAGLCVLLDKSQRLCCVGLDDGEERWERALPGRDPYALSWQIGRELLLQGPEGSLLCRTGPGVYALDLADGSLLWEHGQDYDSRNLFLGLSEDRERLAILERGKGEEGTGVFLLLLSARSGEELWRSPVGDGETVPRLNSSDEPYRAAISFSEDGSLLGLCVYEEPGENASEDVEGQYRLYVLDAASGSVLHSAGFGSPTLQGSIVYGLRTEEGTGTLFCALYSSRTGGILALRQSWEEEERTVTVTDQVIGGDLGTDLSIYGDVISPLPLLWSRDLTLVFCDRSILIYDSDAVSLRRIYEFSAPILDAAWVDREEEIVQMLTADGHLVIYDLGHEGNTAVESATLYTLDASGLSAGKLLGKGPCLDPEGGRVLTVPEIRPDRLLLTETADDPRFQLLPGMSEDDYDLRSLWHSPDGDRIGFLLRGSPDCFVVCDAATGETLSRWELPSEIKLYDAVPLDETHLAERGSIYGMDGSRTLLEEVTEDEFYDSFFESAALTSGGVLTVYTFSLNGPGSLLCWIDGKLVPASAGLETGISYLESRRRALGGGGFLLSWGSHGPEGEDAYALLDCRTGQRYLLEDRCAGTERSLAAGTEKQVFAAADELGGLFLGFPEEGRSLLLEGYGPEEVREMCFADGDDTFWVLTAAGRLDGYLTETGERVFSEYPNGAQEVFGGMRCRTGEGRLWVLLSEAGSYGPMLCIDTEHWVIVQTASDVYDVSPETGFVYARRNYAFGRYPAYGLEDLRSWAEEVLEEG